MKIFTLILSMYVMLLTSVACADNFKFSEGENIAMTTYDTHIEFCGDQCSPFCACTCCVGFTNPPHVVVQPVTSEVIKIPFFYLEEHFKASKYSFLQPPRV